ncbi:uncharacterized protein ASCRUDRAFT_70276 [Ascoidea rubescens DSM 1968]|uniref:Elongin-A n=1 Tax=Ascoidea rubescens DSM 1968 TaxID=1344418 RepID=A0A1D2VHD3_9ASCO|nr:hypothetical protein ASCRUDRAFT_70276 [Ascoidea rubescens DSM 1968]ODV61046.1 hypothetical protein ASCRUDRAFT_70276 [Ascoidea rubescens DSM 1968]
MNLVSIDDKKNRKLEKLSEICVRKLIQSIKLINDFGDFNNYNTLKPILIKMDYLQLKQVEASNPELKGENNINWYNLIIRDFPKHTLTIKIQKEFNNSNDNTKDNKKDKSKNRIKRNYFRMYEKIYNEVKEKRENALIKLKESYKSYKDNKEFKIIELKQPDVIIRKRKSDYSYYNNNGNNDNKRHIGYSNYDRFKSPMMRKISKDVSNKGTINKYSNLFINTNYNSSGVSSGANVAAVKRSAITTNTTNHTPTTPITATPITATTPTGNASKNNQIARNRKEPLANNKAARIPGNKHSETALGGSAPKSTKAVSREGANTSSKRNRSSKSSREKKPDSKKRRPRPTVSAIFMDR